jgi:hypothetical protein
MISLHMGAAGSVAEGKAMAVYLLEQQIPTEAMRAAAYYGQTPGIEDAIAAGYGAVPLLRNDIDPALADALGLKQGQAIGVDDVAVIRAACRCHSKPKRPMSPKPRLYAELLDSDDEIGHGYSFGNEFAGGPDHRVSRRLAFGLTLHPVGGAVQQHAVMRQAKDFYHAVRADTVDYQMAWPADALLEGDKTTAEPQRIDTDPSDFL